MFRRRREGVRPDPVAEEVEAAGRERGAAERDGEGDTAPAVAAGDERDRPGKDERPDGPWDLSEVTDASEGRADLGGLMIPVFEGAELRLEVQDDQVMSVAAMVDQSVIQFQAFAAPRSEGIWGEIRSELAGSITQQGGTVDFAEGPLGAELRAQVPVQLDDGTQGAQMLRFVGCDGPRWFLRGVISGEAAVTLEAGDKMVEMFRGTVVVRGVDPMAPHDPIPLRLPHEAIAEAEAEKARQERDEADFNPYQRGPEITEVR